MNERSRFPVLRGHSLSARLLVLTIGFVMLSEVLIYLPSIARYRLTWLNEHIAAAHLAALALIEAPQHMVSPMLRRELLREVGARAVVLHTPDARYLLLQHALPLRVNQVIHLDHVGFFGAISGAIGSLAAKGRVLRVLGAIPGEPGMEVEMVIDEAPLQRAMYEYSWHILSLSILISVLTAALVYASLQWLIVHPLQRFTACLVAFRQEPENDAHTLPPTDRRDEIGVAESELAVMQQEIRGALRQKARLAALGTAVAKINHDLRNILSSAQVVSDRIAASDDPDVKRVTPRLIATIDRAIALCTATLKFGQADEPPPRKTTFALRPLAEEVAASVGLPADGRIRWHDGIPPEIAVRADRDQLFRVLLNLGRNAVQAIAGAGSISLGARIENGAADVFFRDSGGGFSEAARRHLFEAFTGAGRTGGTGLGLAIARDLMRAQGGEIFLEKTGRQGTEFHLRLPEAHILQSVDRSA